MIAETTKARRSKQRESEQAERHWVKQVRARLFWSLEEQVEMGPSQSREGELADWPREPRNQKKGGELADRPREPRNQQEEDELANKPGRSRPSWRANQVTSEGQRTI